MAGRTVGSARDESGSAPSELVIILPVVILLLFLVVQLAMWGMAAQAVQSAAAAGGQAARSLNANPNDGQTAAQTAINGLGGNMVLNPQVTVDTSSGANTVVRVSGQVYTVIPFFHVTVTAKSQAPQQQYRPSG